MFRALQTVLTRVEHQGCQLDAITQRLCLGTIHSAENKQDADLEQLKGVEFEDFDSRLFGNTRTRLVSISHLVYLIKFGTERDSWSLVMCSVFVMAAPVLWAWRINCWTNSMAIPGSASDAKSCGQLQLVQPESQEETFRPQHCRC